MSELSTTGPLPDYSGKDIVLDNNRLFQLWELLERSPTSSTALITSRNLGYNLYVIAADTKSPDAAMALLITENILLKGIGGLQIASELPPPKGSLSDSAVLDKFRNLIPINLNKGCLLPFIRIAPKSYPFDVPSYNGALEEIKNIITANSSFLEAAFPIRETVLGSLLKSLEHLDTEDCGKAVRMRVRR